MKHNKLVYLFITISLLYALLVMSVPTDPTVLEKYQINTVQARLLNLTVVLPLLAIWYSALYGFVHLRDYAKLILKTKEGKAFSLLSSGLAVVAFAQPVSAIISVWFKQITLSNPDLIPATMITKNYVSLAFAISGFFLLAWGSRMLVISNKPTEKHRPSLPSFIAPVMIVLSSTFTWLVTVRRVSPDDGYQLPNWLIVFTIIVPYLFAWMSGILAAYFLYIYKIKVKGAFYKHAFADIAKGISTVTFVSVLIQLLTIISSQINRLKLTPILAIIYLLIILYAIGFLHIARGAKRLTRLEEV